MKIRKLTNEEIKGASDFAVNIYNIAIRSSFRSQECHRYFDEYMDADRLKEEERTGALVVFGAFERNFFVRSVWHDKQGAYHHAVRASAVPKAQNWQKASGESKNICAHAA